MCAIKIIEVKNEFFTYYQGTRLSNNLDIMWHYSILCLRHIFILILNIKYECVF